MVTSWQGHAQELSRSHWPPNTSQLQQPLFLHLRFSFPLVRQPPHQRTLGIQNLELWHYTPRMSSWNHLEPLPISLHHQTLKVRFQPRNLGGSHGWSHHVSFEASLRGQPRHRSVPQKWRQAVQSQVTDWMAFPSTPGVKCNQHIKHAPLHKNWYLTMETYIKTI